MQSAQFLTVLLVSCLFSAVYGGLDWGSVTTVSSQAGDGTFYGLGQDAQGTCSFSANFANTNGLPWSTGTSLTVALNDAQFADSAACGMCIRLKGTGAGLGTTPIPSTWTNAIVNNRCPECSAGDVDLAAAGDGRWKIQWYAVPCEVGNTPLTYSIVVSSYYWFSMVVSNTRIPITGVSVKIGGSWLQLKRTNNNQWAYYNTNGPWQSSFPMGVRVTSIEGQTVEDTITGVSGNTGTVQFGSGGASSSSAASTTPATPAVTATPSSPPVNPSPSVTPATPPAPVATPPPVPTTPATPPAPSSPLPDGGFYIENYQQCGGTGGSCNTKPYTSAPCSDAAWPQAACRSSNFACVRASADLYTCVPGTSGTTPAVTSTASSPSTPVATAPADSSRATPSASPPAVTTSSPPPVLSTTSPPAPTTASPPPSPTAASPPAPSQQTQQYGIVASTATTVAPSGLPDAKAIPNRTTPAPTSSSPERSPSITPPLSSLTSSLPSSADHASETVLVTLTTTALTPPSPTPPAATQQSNSPPVPTQATTSQTTAPAQTSSPGGITAAIAISAGGQCGGTSSCDPVGTATDKVTCNNGPWSGAYCPSNYECKASPGPLVWTCMASSTATAGRRLLS